MRKDIEQIQAEVTTETKANKPQKTFAYKWMQRAYRLTIGVDLFAVLLMILQFVLFVAVKEAPVIPGQAVVYSGAMLITAAFVGGEEIVDKIMDKGGVPNG